MEATFTNSLGMEFVLIPAGTFRMGRNLPPGWAEAREMMPEFDVAEWAISHFRRLLRDYAGPATPYWKRNLHDYNLLDYEFEMPELVERLKGAKEDYRQAKKRRKQYLLENDAPWHEVCITRPFYMGRYPVTQAQWAAAGWRPSDRSVQAWECYLDDIDPCHSKDKTPDTPVFNVYWKQIEEFLDLLNERGEAGRYRLPTEAEWEYAARAGTTTAWPFGDDRAQLKRHAWFGGYEVGRPHPVGRKLPNPWGLYDMHGNVWEWVSDLYDEAYYARSPVCDPQGPETGDCQVIRGGGHSSGSRACQSGFRGFVRKSYSYRKSKIGLRLVLTVEE